MNDEAPNTAQHTAEPRPAALLLAAGASRRMGSPKPLLPWAGTTLIAWEVQQLREAGVDEIVVVLGARAEAVRRATGTAAVQLVFNQRWPQGRATSLAAGARALLRRTARPSAVVIQNVDQPTRAAIVRYLLDSIEESGASVVQPCYLGKAGHPVVLSGALLDELAEVHEQTLGLRALLDRHPPHLVTMDDEPVVRLDLDTPDLLDEGRRLLGVGN